MRTLKGVHFTCTRCHSSLKHIGSSILEGTLSPQPHDGGWHFDLSEFTCECPLDDGPPKWVTKPIHDTHTQISLKEELTDFFLNDFACELLRKVLNIPGVAEAALLAAYKAPLELAPSETKYVSDIPFAYIWDKIQQDS